MPRYKVRDGEHILHDGKEYNAGDTIACTEAQAKMLRVDLIGETKSTNDPDKDPNAGKKPEDDLSAKELIEKIKTMTDVKELGAMFKNETRTTVIDALKARIKELKAAEKK